ncbi:MAG: c-type cytochrome [Burkholderiaceae bacterium]
MRRFIALLLLSGLAVFGKAMAEDTEQLNGLLLKNQCLSCHLIDKRKYGPVLREVAAKYAGDASAVTTLAAKIKAGGTGVWGEDIMPPQPHVSDADAKQLVTLILSLQPKK